MDSFISSSFGLVIYSTSHNAHNLILQQLQVSKFELLQQQQQHSDLI